VRARTPKRIYSELTRPSRAKTRTTPPKRIHSKHRLYELKNSLAVLGKRALDKTTPVGRALRHWRRELMDDLGGPESVSKQQSVIIDLCVKTHLLLQSIDNWLLQVSLSHVFIQSREPLHLLFQSQQTHVSGQRVRQLLPRSHNGDHRFLLGVDEGLLDTHSLVMLFPR
jgi:hypothetical protein